MRKKLFNFLLCSLSIILLSQCYVIDDEIDKKVEEEKQEAYDEAEQEIEEIISELSTYDVVICVFGEGENIFIGFLGKVENGYAYISKSINDVDEGNYFLIIRAERCIPYEKAKEILEGLNE